MTENLESPLETEIERWRTSLRLQEADREKLEETLREEIARLTAVGLAPDEAFLIAVKRIGSRDAAGERFARERVERVWKESVATPVAPFSASAARRDLLIAFCLAVAAAIAIKLPALFGLQPGTEETFYPRNASLLAFPILTAYFALKRRLNGVAIASIAAGFVAAAAAVNAYPFAPGGATEVLAILHLPIALWLLVGIAYASGRWSDLARRMDFVRFSGELFIDYVLIALGGAVFSAAMMMIFEAIGINAQPFLQSWLIPCGAAGAVIIASWLVEGKESVAENMAPVLTRIFTPLFAGLLITFLVTLVLTGRGIGMDRNVLIAFDLLLVVIVGLLLYAISARDPLSPPGAFDVVQVVLVISALIADAVALSAIAARITDLGFTPNRVAALGENAILLINLAWSAVLYVRFLRGRGSFAALERWQTRYLPVYAIWAALVVIVFPPLFAFA
ncbi:MAG: hypothetical protein WBX15_10430 [Thermoanaerobaculia bacterium]